MLKAVVGAPGSSEMVKATVQSGPIIPDCFNATVSQSRVPDIKSMETILSSNSKLTEFLSSFATYLSNCESAKATPVDKPVVKPDPVLTMADINQPTTVKKIEKIKEKNIKMKTQKKSVKVCLHEAASAFPPYPQFER